MSKKAVEWLYRELPDLVSKGILTPEAAENLRRHYGVPESTLGTRTVLLIFGVIGVILVGLGVILILAHNWESLSKITRLLIAVALLLLSQIISGLTLYKKQDSLVWRESAGTFQFLMIGASMALVGQTYHLTEDTDAFLRTWLLLSLPVIYLLSSRSVGIFYTLGLTAWTTGSSFSLESQWSWLLLLLGLVIPHYYRLIKLERYANTTVITCWVANLCFYIAFTALFSRFINQFSLLIYSALFTCNALMGRLWFYTGKEGWSMPFRFIGLAGSTGLLFLLTFNSFWDQLDVRFSPSMPETSLVTIVLLLLLSAQNQFVRRCGWQDLPVLFAPFIVAGGYLLNLVDLSGMAATILVNLFFLYISLRTIRTGVHRQQLGLVNTGMLLLAAVIAARFLDIHFSFIIRGLVFMLLGLAFLGANLYMVRRKGGGGT
jgi:uncharacterized membrane protein